MWINDEVDPPEALISAQREGRLVIFAGAGDSLGLAMTPSPEAGEPMSSSQAPGRMSCSTSKTAAAKTSSTRGQGATPFSMAPVATPTKAAADTTTSNWLPAARTLLSAAAAVTGSGSVAPPQDRPPLTEDSQRGF